MLLNSGVLFLLSIIASCIADDSFVLSKLNEGSGNDVTNPVLDEFFYYAGVYGIATCFLKAHPNQPSDTNITIVKECDQGYCDDARFQHLEFVDGFWPDNTSNATFMMSLYDHNRKESFVILVGTTTLINQKMDLDITTAPYTPLVIEKNLTTTEHVCEDCVVHRGFYETWKADFDFTLDNVKKMGEEFPDYKTVLLGHSLGGSAVQLAAIELQLLGISPLVLSFGAPQIGSKTFVSYLNNITHAEDTFETFESGKFPLTGNIRNEHKPDRVPKFLDNVYYHGGVEVWIAKLGDYPTPADIAICDPDYNIDGTCGGYPDSLVPANTTVPGGTSNPHRLYYVDIVPCGTAPYVNQGSTIAWSPADSSSSPTTSSSTSPSSASSESTTSSSESSSPKSTSSGKSEGISTKSNGFLLGFFAICALLI